MPYREKKIYSGKILEIDIYPISFQERKHKRKRKEKESQPKQKNLNDKNAKKHLTRLINTNFTDNDLVVHLTYEDKYLPKSEEEAKKDITNFLRRIKNYRKKNNLEDLKYVAVIEYRDQEEGKKPIRIHHHIIINSMDRDKLEELWGKGRANADRLKADEYGYEALAKYITKDPKGSKRWTQSRNLKQPTIKVNDFKISKRKVQEMAMNPEDRAYYEKMYPGYYFTECKSTLNDIVGCSYINLKMRKIE